MSNFTNSIIYKKERKYDKEDDIFKSMLTTAILQHLIEKLENKQFN